MPTLKLDLLVDGDPAAVWAAVGGFTSIAEWHPEVQACEPGQDDQGRQLRTITYKNGQQVVERLVRMDDVTQGYLYAIDKGKLPVRFFNGQFQVYGNRGLSHIVWTMDFDVVEGYPEERALAIMDGILQSARPGLEARASARPS